MPVSSAQQIVRQSQGEAEANVAQKFPRVQSENVIEQSRHANVKTNSDEGAWMMELVAGRWVPSEARGRRMQ